jgi:hypothetical protein
LRSGLRRVPWFGREAIERACPFLPPTSRRRQPASSTSPRTTPLASAAAALLKGYAARTAGLSACGGHATATRASVCGATSRQCTVLRKSRGDVGQTPFRVK